MYANKEVGVQILKWRNTSGSYKGEVAWLHPTFLLRKQYLFCFEIIISPPPPPNAPPDVENGLYRP